MEPYSQKPDSGPDTRKYILGILVIAAGLLLLVGKLPFFPDRIFHILFSFPMLITAIGAAIYFGGGNRTPGVILMVIGITLMLPRIINPELSSMHFFWPVVLIGIGVLLLYKRIPRRPSRHTGTHAPNFQTGDGYIQEEHIFSGGKQRIVHQEFKGGQINVVFGGSEIDLTQSTLGEGVNELEVNAIFGGVTIIVPADWKVQLKMTSIMGGFTDKRFYVKETGDPSRTLVIKGSTIFGGGELKCYPS